MDSIGELKDDMDGWLVRSGDGGQGGYTYSEQSLEAALFGALRHTPNADEEGTLTVHAMQVRGFDGIGAAGSAFADEFDEQEHEIEVPKSLARKAKEISSWATDLALGVVDEWHQDELDEVR